MSRRTLLLLVAGIIAAFTAISVRNRLSHAPVAEAPVVSARVVVAKHDLEVGSFVQGAQDLDWGAAPQNATVAPPPPEKNASGELTHSAPPSGPDSYLHEGMVKLTDFNGAVVRIPLHAGQPVPSNALMKSGEGGFMSAVLNPGMRAVSISVAPNTNGAPFVAGFVSPGDHVDLIVTHRVKTHTGESNSDAAVVSETFVHNVRVVAVDQMLDNPDNKTIMAKTVTVEVSPRQAEQIAVAGEMGQISIALRSSLAMPKPAAKPSSPITDLYGNPAGDNGADYTSDSDLNQMKSVAVPHVQVIRGDKSETLEFYRDAQ